MKLFILILIALTLNLTAEAHDGHNHEAPKNIQAPKGGVLKRIEDTYIEVVAKKQDIKIYFYDSELKSLTTNDFKVFAKVSLPKSSKNEPLALTKKPALMEATYDAKKWHRYNIILTIENVNHNQKETLIFTVEPKK